MTRKRHLPNDNDAPTDTCEVCATEAYPMPHFYRKGDMTKEVTICEECLENYQLETKVEFEDSVISAGAFDEFSQWCKRERILMFTDITDGQTINNEQDVEEFFDALTAYLNWHPDTKFREYVRLGTDGNERTFSDTESKMLDEAMARCFGIADKANKDIYSIGLDALQRAGVAPKETPHPETAENITPLAKAMHLLRDFTDHLREARDESDTDHKLAMLDGGIAEELIQRGEKLLKQLAQTEQ